MLRFITCNPISGFSQLVELSAHYLYKIMVWFLVYKCNSSLNKKQINQHLNFFNKKDVSVPR